MAVLPKVSRTEIIMEKEFYEQDPKRIREIWESLCGDQNAMMRPRVDGDVVHLMMYPFRHMEITHEGMQVPKNLRTNVPWMRKLVMNGTFPEGELYYPTADIVRDRLWMPIRRSGKPSSSHYLPNHFNDMTQEEKSDLNSIVMTIGGVRDPEHPHIQTTEITFQVSVELHQPTKKLSADERIVRALDNAVWHLAEALRIAISDVNPKLMVCAAMLDDLSCKFSEAIEAEELDRLQQKMSNMGLRYVDDDSRVPDNSLETAAAQPE